MKLIFQKIKIVENCNSNDLKMKYFGCWREGCDNGLVIQRPFGVCVSFFEFYLKGEDGRRKRDAEEAPPQVGGAQVTLIAILRSLSVKTKENIDFALLMQLSTFQLFLEFYSFFSNSQMNVLVNWNVLPPDVTSKMIKTSLDKAGLDK